MKHLIVASALAAPFLVSGLAGAQSARPDPYLNDAETEFSIVNTYDTKDGLQFNPGYALRIKYVLYATAKVQQGSTLKLTVKQGSKDLGSAICAVPHVQTPYVSDTCYDKDQKIKAVGDIDVGVELIDGATDKATPLRSYKLKVMTATQIRGNLVPAASQQYVSWHGRALENFLVMDGQKSVSLWLRHAPNQNDSSFSMLDAALFCSVDGKLLEMPRDWQGSSSRRGMTEQVVARTAQVGQAMQNEYRKTTGRLLMLPITWGDNPLGGYLKLEDNPGKWECKFKLKGKLTRTLRFTVADGKIAPHPEQKAGLNTPDNFALVDMDIPADAAIDEVLAPDEVQHGAFFGRPWATPEGKAMAAKVPKKGVAHYPQPKNLDFGKPVKKWEFKK